MYTPEFRIHFVEFVSVDALMALRFETKGWNAAADALMDEGVRSGEIIVHDGKNIDYRILTDAREERFKVVKQVIFVLNITKVRKTCRYAVNLIVVDTPKGVERFGGQRSSSACLYSGCSGGGRAQSSQDNHST